VFVVRPGTRSEIPHDAEIYMLTDARTLVMFRLNRLIDTLCWVKPDALFVRVHGRRQQGYRETVQTDEAGGFVRFRRTYEGASPRLARVALTCDRNIASFWQSTCGEDHVGDGDSDGNGNGDGDGAEPKPCWRRLRGALRSKRRETASVAGSAYDRGSDYQVAQFVNDLIDHWHHPNATMPNIRKLRPRVWAYEGVELDPSVKVVGPAWIGAGRTLEPGCTVLGPAAVWDAPDHRPPVAAFVWADIEPSQWTPLALAIRRNTHFSFYRLTKRLFDILVSLAMLVFCLPVYAIVMLAIWWEDGRPFFFVHNRETVGGRDFPCIKFRSMRKDADRIKLELEKQNRADGPQFYLPDDPRITAVGRALRRWNIDELPQFLNVLLGQMSVVGPRPSPTRENQFCPPWREARLSVRPGITGLWQVMRTRTEGLDFQEWIRYDLQYVERAGWWLDLKILLKTARIVFLD
jgi:lipopolysaccharide/colanic/teichoic acid biosynthesis glycosyltransferase